MADEFGPPNLPPKLEAFLAGRSRVSQVELDALVSTVSTADGTSLSNANGMAHSPHEPFPSRKYFALQFRCPIDFFCSLLGFIVI